MNLTSFECVRDLFENKKTKFLNCIRSTPPFASNMFFELYSNEEGKNHYVKIQYNGKYYNLCEKKQKFCDLNEFINRLEYFTIPNFKDFCENGPSSFENQLLKNK